MSQSDPNPDGEVSASRRKRWSRLVLLALALGLLFFFPRLRRAELEFQIEVDQPKCVERVEVRLLRGEHVARSSTVLLEERSPVVMKMKVERTDYRAVMKLHCRDGATAIAWREPIVVDEDRVIQFNGSGTECRCSER